MSQRDHYPPGVPCFVDRLTTDIDAAKRFYAGIFGWDFAGPGRMPDNPAGEYWVARLRGHDVAAIGSRPTAGPPASGWNTHVAVQSADEAAAEARRAGGKLLAGPFDAMPAGRMAVLADPSGATFCVWEARARQGAGLVNEPSAWSMSLLSTDEPDTATEFYGRLFGWETERFDPGDGVDLWLWRLPGYLGGEPQQPVARDVVAAMTMLDGASGAPASWSVDFWISDADSAVAAALELGGSVLAPPADAASFKRAVLADPHGAAFSTSQLQPSN
jgi:predicted enzyme related to lactoylglutathione lyase